MAYWVALHLIFTKYAAVASSTNKQMAESIKKQEMPREEHWKAARVLAKEVFDKLGVEIAAVTNRTDN